VTGSREQERRHFSYRPHADDDDIDGFVGHRYS
jgi:hypothetical protein